MVRTRSGPTEYKFVSSKRCPNGELPSDPLTDRHRQTPKLCKKPLSQLIEKAYAWGRSQTGRCLRDFVYRGFNADAGGRKVFDGILPHVAGAGRMWLNHRFANADVSGGQQYEDHFNPADTFPFSYAETTDHLTGRRDAILKHPETDPLVIHTQTSTEYWQRRGSLAHTDTRGNDLPQPAGVRIYMWASSQHFADPLPKKPERGVCQNYLNPVATSMLFRAMIDAMDRWATTGAPPPDSRIPRRADAPSSRSRSGGGDSPLFRGRQRRKRRARCRC